MSIGIIKTLPRISYVFAPYQVTVFGLHARCTGQRTVRTLFQARCAATALHVSGAALPVGDQACELLVPVKQALLFGLFESHHA